MPEDRKFIDPTSDIVEADLPLIVFSDDRQGFVGWKIKSHTKANYNHQMKMVRLGFVVTQGITYKEIPIQEYMRSNQFLKFWRYDLLTEQYRQLIKEAVERDLNAKWWRRSYDFLGIVGQALHIRWLQSPFQKYCSEREASHWRIVPELRSKIPPRPSPGEFNAILKGIPAMKIIGYCWSD